MLHSLVERNHIPVEWDVVCSIFKVYGAGGKLLQSEIVLKNASTRVSLRKNVRRLRNKNGCETRMFNITVVIVLVYG